MFIVKSYNNISVSVPSLTPFEHTAEMLWACPYFICLYFIILKKSTTDTSMTKAANNTLGIFVQGLGDRREEGGWE